MAPAQEALGLCDQYAVEAFYGPLCPFTGFQPIFAWNISESGDLCGFFGDCETSNDRAFAWFGQPPVVTLQLTQQFPFGRALDVNSAGLIVGRMNQPSGGAQHAFRHQEGVTSGLTEPSWANWSEALAVNERGDIAGYALNSATGPLQAVAWIDNQLVEFDLPAGPNSVANDINEATAVCGWMGQTPNTEAQGFIWQNGMTTILPELPDEFQSDPTSINSQGDVAGIGLKWNFPLPGEGRAFVWSMGQVIPLGVLPNYTNSGAFDINDHREVVGYCVEPKLPDRAFIWRDSVMTDLNDLISPDLGLYVAWAMGINNQGQIAGVAVDARGEVVAVRLNPVPPVTGDTNCDRLVDIFDLLNVITDWGLQDSPADVDGDGIVFIPDLFLVIGNWSE